MRYVIVDELGNTRGSFDTHEELVEALRGVEQRRPTAAAAFLVETYDADGAPAGELRGGDEVLNRATVVSGVLVRADAVQARISSATTTTLWLLPAFAGTRPQGVPAPSGGRRLASVGRGVRHRTSTRQ